MNETEVRAAIDTFLQDVLGAIPCYDLEEQGGNGSACWAFWVLQDDTTSYVHPPDAVWPDYRIEWYGTMWEPTNA